MSKISELSDGGSLVSSDYLIAVRSGGNVKVRMDQINVDQVDLGDNEFIRLGNSQDLTMVHTSTQSIINQAGIGDLLIQKAGTTKASITANGLEFPDNSKAIFGAGSDLQIYHDGSNSFIEDTDTGSLFLKTNGAGVYLYSGSEALATFNLNGANNFYYDNGLKLATTATGIDVTGSVTASGEVFIAEKLTHTGDTDTHFKFAGANDIRIVAGGVDHAAFDGTIVFNQSGSSTMDFRVESDTNENMLFVDASANLVGIGTGSPAGLLNLHSASGDSNLFITTGNTAASTNIFFGDTDNSSIGRIVYDHNGNYMNFRTNGSDALRLDASGNVGIGVSTSLDNKLEVNGGAVRVRGTSTPSVKFNNGDAETVAIRLNGGATGTLGLRDDKVLIDANGNLILGTTDSSASASEGIKLKAAGNANSVSIVSNRSTSADEGFTMWSTYANTWRFYVGWDGTIHATSNTIAAISDQRLKSNIRDLDDGLSKVMQLKPRKFDWKEGKGADIKDARGFIAQEFEEVFPDLIGEWKDPAPEGEEPYKSVSQDLIPTLVKAIQEQQTTIEALTARIAALES